jgi:hypothetical protein
LLTAAQLLTEPVRWTEGAVAQAGALSRFTVRQAPTDAEVPARRVRTVDIAATKFETLFGQVEMEFGILIPFLARSRNEPDSIILGK